MLPARSAYGALNTATSSGGRLYRSASPSSATSMSCRVACGVTGDPGPTRGSRNVPTPEVEVREVWPSAWASMRKPNCPCGRVCASRTPRSASLRKLCSDSRCPVISVVTRPSTPSSSRVPGIFEGPPCPPTAHHVSPAGCPVARNRSRMAQ